MVRWKYITKNKLSDIHRLIEIEENNYFIITKKIENFCYIISNNIKLKMVEVNASGIPPEVLLCALYTNSKVQGMGIVPFLLNRPPSNLQDFVKIYEASSTKYFDYVNGKVIKTNLSNMEEIESYLYDRYNKMFEDGQEVSKLEKIVQSLRNIYPYPYQNQNQP